MNFEALKEEVGQIKEIKPIGRTFNVDGVICHVMGMILQEGGVLQLLILKYDDDYREKAEQAELDGINDVYDKPVTNRIEESGERKFEPVEHFFGAEKVSLGELEFTPSKSGSSVCCVCSTSQWRNVTLFTRFLLCGWNPSGIDTQNMDYMYLTSLTFDGEYSSIPDFEVSVPIRFSMRPTVDWRLVEKPMMLKVGGDYNEKLHFTDKKTGQQHWMQINRVFLYDIWSEFEKLFADHRVKEHLSEEELAQWKAELEANLADDCPKGMYYLAVDYECEDDISIQFYSKHWLGEVSKPKNYIIGIIVDPEKSIGKLGMKLKTALIQEPVPPDTKVIEAELFGCFVSTVKDDTVI